MKSKGKQKMWQGYSEI